MGRCDQMFKSGFCQGRDWGPSWAQVGQSGSSYASPLTAVGTGVGCGDTHHPAVYTTAMPGLRKHTHMHMVMHRYRVHPQTHSLPPWQRHLQPPPAVRILYPRGRSWTTPLLPGPHLPQAGLFPPCPVFPPPSSHGALHPEAHRVWPAQHVGRGRRPNFFPPSQTPIPPHSTPAFSPGAPTQQAPPTHP